MYILFSVIFLAGAVSGNWHEWWTYDGISGPSYWGVINPAWNLCNKGRKQSPINIDPKDLVYDPKLQSFYIDKQPMTGVFENTGQSLVFKNQESEKNPAINITGGPLTYRYQFEKLFLHWGNGPESLIRFGGSLGGSEHTINGYLFSAEIQIYGFNAHLFTNLSDALSSPSGVVGVAIMIQESEHGTSEGLKPFTTKLSEMTYRDKAVPLYNVNLGDLLPSTDQYVTYEGSTTYPGCWETVTWIIVNKPLYISRKDLTQLRQLMRGDKLSPKSPLGDNLRPLQGLHNRSVRTNINFDKFVITKTAEKPIKNKTHANCPNLLNEVVYKSNLWIGEP